MNQCLSYRQLIIRAQDTKKNTQPNPIKQNESICQATTLYIFGLNLLEDLKFHLLRKFDGIAKTLIVFILKILESHVDGSSKFSLF